MARANPSTSQKIQIQNNVIQVLLHTIKHWSTIFFIFYASINLLRIA